MSSIDAPRVKKPLAVVCDSEAAFQAFLAWRGLERDTQAVKCSSEWAAKEYVRMHGKPSRSRVVLLPVNKVPPHVMPTLGYKRRPDVPKKGTGDEPTVVPDSDHSGDLALGS